MLVPSHSSRRFAARRSGLAFGRQGLDSPPGLRECSLAGRYRIRVCRVDDPVSSIRSPALKSGSSRPFLRSG